MAAASKTAIAEATGVVFKSIRKENDIHTDYLLDPAVCPPSSMVEAENGVSALEMALALLDRSLGGRIVQAKKERNAFLPISQLPVEMLTEIFHYVLGSHELRSPEKPYHLTSLKTLASVCADWRSLVSCTPSLWAVLESTCPLTFLPTAIRKAKGSPLNIRCSWEMPLYFPVVGPPTKDLSAFLNAIIPLANRWDTLYLDIGRTDPPIIKILAQSLPNLRHASIKYNVWDSYNQCLDSPFGGTTPHLRQLRLHQVSIDWTLVELENLYTLAISNSRSPPFPRLLSFVEKSPELEHLELSNLRQEAVTFNAPITTPKIVLPCLETLVLKGLNFQVASNLIRLLYPHRLKTLGIAVLPQPEEHHSIVPYLEHLMSAIQSSFHEAKTVGLEITDPHATISLKRASGDDLFMLDARVVGTAEVEAHMAWLKGNVELSKISSGSILLSGSDTIRSAVQFKILEWIPNVTELEICDGVKEMLHYLSERICVDKQVTWRCPHLREACFSDYSASVTDVMEFAKRRYGDRPKNDGSNEDGDLVVHWPDTLKSLNLEGLGYLDYDTVEELKNITGCKEITGFEEEELDAGEFYDYYSHSSDEDSLGSMDLYDIFALVGQ
ncbi:hypothetical protein FRB90_007276 [Tulasnella sp. 427]|nr:hypothetical protein FRB90_007276 [Tulasnella sp. 427]